jgi:imidazolonepropionase-like amidohydrolase
MAGLTEVARMQSRAVGIALCLLATAAAGIARGQAPARTWITDVRIVSPERLDHVERGSVLIDGGKIARVDRSGQARAPAGAKVISGHGQFLIPGLIDSHVHLASIPGMDFGQEAANAPMVKAYLAQLPRSYLYFGYTTLVDLAVVEPEVLADFRKAPLHPDLFDCGESLPVANGYPMSFAPPAVRFKVFPNFIYDSSQASSIPAEYRPEDHTPSADVARVKQAGGICIKTYYEHGFGRDRHLPVMSAGTFAGVRRAATDAGLVLMVHANSFEAQRFAEDGGADVIAHGMWNWGDLDRRQDLPGEITALLDRIVANRTGYQPTMQVIEGLRVYFDPQYLAMPAIPKVIPPAMLAWFKTPAGAWFRSELADSGMTDSAERERYDRGPIRRGRQVVAYLARKDANFLFGTDTPSSPTYGNLPGLNGYMEMQDLHRAGLTLAQIFRAATISNAREFRIDSGYGTIEPGKVANLVLLRRSPLESVDAYDSISMVWVHGRATVRDSLAATKGTVK